MDPKKPDSKPRSARLVWPAVLIARAILIATFAGALAACSAMGLPGKGMPAAPASQAATPVAQSANQPLPRSARFDALSVEEGLSQSAVNDIVQDRQGYLWFATQDGLNRYDGYNFRVYTNNPHDSDSLSHNNTTQIIEDRQGRLWIGTINAGLNRFDPATGKFTRYKINKQAGSLSDNSINVLLEDHEGTIWVGTPTGGLNRYNPQTNDFTWYQNNPDDPGSLSVNGITDLLETPDGVLWVGTPKGLDQFDRSTGSFIHHHKNPGDPNSFSSEDVSKLAGDGQGRVWVGSKKGTLDRFDPRTGQINHYLPDPSNPKSLPGDQINALLVDRIGFLWVGLYGKGLCRLEPGEANFTCFRHDPAKSDSLAVDNITSFYEDRSGILWVGTFGGGVNKLDPGYKSFVNLVPSDAQNPNGLSGGVVFAVYQDSQGYLWVGLSDRGLDRVDRKTGQVTNFRNDPADPTSLSSNMVLAIFEDREGTLWVGTKIGLNRFDRESGKFTRYMSDPEDSSNLMNSTVHGIREDSQGNLWIATWGGLNRLDRATGKFAQFQSKPGDPNSLASVMVTCLYVDSGGFLWVGMADKGVDRFDPRTGKVIHFTSNADDPKSLSDTYVMSVFEDSRGTIWVGTIGGLNHLIWSSNKTSGIFQQYRVQDGLPNDYIYAIQEDSQNQLWISTNKGLARFDPQKGTFKNFDVRDGLQSNEFDSGASYKTNDGEMIFGGIRGVTMFRPEDIRDNPYVPPVVLTTLIQHGERVDMGTNQTSEITLRWPDNYFDFEFAALNYIRPENNQYAYRLDGFDRDWNLTGAAHSGRYTNLPGGAYSLRLKGSNNDGVWNESGAAIQVKVVPPFWATWWFRGAFVLLVIGGVMGGVRLRVRGVEARNLKLERLVQARTVEIQKLYEQTKELAVVEERNRLARDLHDSAKQKAFAALAQLGAANGLVRSDPPRAHTALREAETLVYEVIEELTFLIQEMYPAALKEKGLAAVLREYIFEWESRSDIQVNYRIEHEHPLELKTEQALYRVIQEALANVARHSKASQVEIEVMYEPDEITFSIADDGQGFDMNRRPAGVGLRSMQERIAMIGGKLMIESAPGKGTRLFACAPIPH